MAIILGETDLKPLLSQPEGMDELLYLVEESMCAQARGAVGGQVRCETSLFDPKKKIRITTAAVPGIGQGMRINGLVRTAKDAHFILLFDGESGDLHCVIAGREINIWRTGCPAGVAAKYLAPANADAVGLIGSGRQARGQLLALRRALPRLRSAKVFSRKAENRENFAREMSIWLDLKVEAAGTAEDATTGMPIISLATSSRSTVIEPEWVTPGALVISITSGQLPAKIVGNSRVVVSWKEEVLAGEGPREPYTSMIARGEWSGDMIVAELGDVILGKAKARAKPEDIVVFESAGTPAWDSCAAQWAYRWAVEQGVGKELSLA